MITPDVIMAAKGHGLPAQDVIGALLNSMAVEYFLCRHCHDLKYPSQYYDGISRGMANSDKVEEKLGGNIRKKPKGMHWKTYNRLIEQYNMANTYGWFFLGMRIGKIK